MSIINTISYFYTHVKSSSRDNELFCISERFKVNPESVSFTFSTQFEADIGVEFPH